MFNYYNVNEFCDTLRIGQMEFLQAITGGKELETTYKNTGGKIIL